MKIIGLVGLVGSGKDTVSDYLAKKYGYKMVSMGDIVRELATGLGRSHNRDDLQRTQKEYREKHGDRYFGELVVKKIRELGSEKVVINGIRIPEDAGVPKESFGKDMVVLLVDVNPRIRFERMAKRKRIGDPQTFEEFSRQENNELRLFNFDGVLKHVGYKISNEGTLQELHGKVDEFLNKFENMNSTMERTLVLIKPDGVERNLTGEIIRRFQEAGMKLIALRMIQADVALVAKHYPMDPEYCRTIGEKSAAAGDDVGDPEAHGRMIVEGLRKYLTKGPVVAMVYEGENAIKRVREITGYTDPSQAKPGTIRGDLGEDSILAANKEKRPCKNLIHASGNEKEAKHEISLWFKPAELVGK